MAPERVVTVREIMMKGPVTLECDEIERCSLGL